MRRGNEREREREREGGGEVEWEKGRKEHGQNKQRVNEKQKREMKDWRKKNTWSIREATRVRPARQHAREEISLVWRAVDKGQYERTKKHIYHIYQRQKETRLSTQTVYGRKRWNRGGMKQVVLPAFSLSLSLPLSLFSARLARSLWHTSVSNNL